MERQLRLAARSSQRQPRHPWTRLESAGHVYRDNCERSSLDNQQQRSVRQMDPTTKFAFGWRIPFAIACAD